MARKGLGKGLDSLIPDIYNEDFDSNSAQSLEDMLGDDSTSILNEDEKTEEAIEETPDEDISEDESGDDSSEDVVDETPEEETSTEVEEVVDETPEEVEEETPETEEVVDETPEEVEEEIPEVAEEVVDDTPEEVEEEILEEPVVQIEYNQEHIDEVKKIVDKNPRITLWSSRSSAVFRYLRKTEPEFSISKEASKLIEEAVCKKYPEIWALFDEDDD